MLESAIAGVVISLVGALVTFGLHRLERHLHKQDQDASAREQKDRDFRALVTGALDQHGRDIGAIGRKLKMERQPDGQLAELYRRRRA